MRAIWVPALAVLLSCATATTTLFVDCATGSDTSGTGSQNSPFLTPNRARDAIRSLQPLAQAVTVLVKADCYPRGPDSVLNYSVPVLELFPEDSGTAAAPITYKSGPGGRSRLIGGAPLPASTWRPYKDGIFVADLSSSGLNLVRAFCNKAPP